MGKGKREGGKGNGESAPPPTHPHPFTLAHHARAPCLDFFLPRISYSMLQRDEGGRTLTASAQAETDVESDTEAERPAGGQDRTASCSELAVFLPVLVGQAS